MCDSQKPAGGIVDFFRFPCSTVVSGFLSENRLQSFLPVVRGLLGPCRRFPTRRAIGTILEYIQAGQQEPRREISPIYPAIEGWRTAFYSLRLQGSRQLVVTPVARLHPTLYQQDCLKPPVFHSLRRCLRCRGCRVKRKRAANSGHFGGALDYRVLAGQLKTILSHTDFICLYLCLNQLKVIPHA